MAFWRKNGNLVGDADGNLINCDHCPCTDSAVLAFVVTKEENNKLDYCYQQLQVYPSGICGNKIYYTYGGLYGTAEQVQITITRGVRGDKIGTYHGVIGSEWDWYTQSYIDVIAQIDVYLLTDIYEHYNDFKEVFYSYCTCYQGDIFSTTGCGRSHVPSVTWYANQCTNEYWQGVASNRYIVQPYWAVNRRRLYGRIECGSNYWTTRQDPQDPLKYHYYYGQYIINNEPWQAFGWYGCHQQRSPSQCTTQQWTLAKTQGWLGAGVAGINAQITRYFADLSIWQASDYVQHITYKCYTQFPYHNSQQYCIGASAPNNDAETVEWSYYDIKCEKNPNTPADAKGISADLEYVKKDYTGQYDPQSYQPIYTQTTGTISHDFLWGETYKTPIADNISHTITQHNATTCDESRPGPCDKTYCKYEWKLVAKEYIY